MCGRGSCRLAGLQFALWSSPAKLYSSICPLKHDLIGTALAPGGPCLRSYLCSLFASNRSARHVTLLDRDGEREREMHKERASEKEERRIKTRLLSLFKHFNIIGSCGLILR
ncbi:hypothetical protein F2P79_007583 [Pimephales promelas]|nr:hypothetical protein F2P79_007583 [Pimephales promelas]